MNKTLRPLAFALFAVVLSAEAFSQSAAGGASASAGQQAPAAASPFAMADVPALAISGSTQEVLRPATVNETPAGRRSTTRSARSTSA